MGLAKAKRKGRELNRRKMEIWRARKEAQANDQDLGITNSTNLMEEGGNLPNSDAMDSTLPVADINDSDITNICIICCYPSAKPKGNVDMGKYLVEHVIPSSSLIPDENFHHLLDQSDRIKFCKGCHRLLSSAQRIQAQMAKLRDEFRQVKNKVKSLVAESMIIKKEGLENGEYSEMFELYQQIREQLVTDFNPNDNNYVDYNDINEAPEWFGMDFLGEDDDKEDEIYPDADINAFGSDPLALTLDLSQMDEKGLPSVVDNKTPVKRIKKTKVINQPAPSDSLKVISKPTSGKLNTNVMHESDDMGQNSLPSTVENNKTSSKQIEKIKNPVLKKIQQQSEPEPHSSVLLEDSETFQNFQRKELMSTYSKRTPTFRQAKPFKDSDLRPRPQKNTGRQKRIMKKTNLVAPDESQEHPEDEHKKCNETKQADRGLMEQVLSAHTVTTVRFPALSRQGEERALEVRKFVEPPQPRAFACRRNYPCIICPDVFKSSKDAELHRKFIHPGLAACVSPIRSLQCGKIFKPSDLKRHKKETHPLLNCLQCVETFSTKVKLVDHISTCHSDDGPSQAACASQPTSDVPDCGYDTKLIPWANPLSKEQILEATSGKGIRSLRISLERVITDNPSSSIPSVEELSQNIIVEEKSGSDSDINKPSPTSLSNKELSKETTLSDMESSKEPFLPNSDSTVNENKSCDTKTVSAKKMVPPKRKKIMYNCGVCNTKFLAESELFTHLQQVHNSKPKFACIVCQEPFQSLSECQSHISTEHQQLLASTASSTANIPNVSKPLSKDEENAKAWPFWCIQCRLRFANLEVLQEHLQSDEHILTGQVGRKEPCPVKGCSYYYRGKADLNAHDLSRHCHKPRKTHLTCPDCTHVYYNEQNFIKHRMEKHQFVPTEPFHFKSPARLNCSKCDKTFAQYHLLLSHMARVHDEVNDAKRCPKCKRYFATRKIMIRHMKIMHIPGDFECTVCSKRFVTMTRLREHSVIHGEARPYLCAQCGKSFKTTTSLTIHNYSHDPDRWTKHYPYKILVQRRLETQKKREQKAEGLGGHEKCTKKNKSSIKSPVPGHMGVRVDASESEGVTVGSISAPENFVQP